MRHHLRIRSAALAVVAATSLLVGLGPPATGQSTTSDPYGSTVPPTEPPGDPTCTIDQTQVEVGGTVTGTIVGLEAGAEVDLTIAGEVLATVVADAAGEADFSLVVPEIAETTVVIAVGVTFNVECGEVDPGAVLGATEEQTGGGAETASGGEVGSETADGSDADSDSGSDTLARTGTTVLPLVALGLIALAVGAYLRRRSRARPAV